MSQLRKDEALLGQTVNLQAHCSIMKNCNLDLLVALAKEFDKPSEKPQSPPQPEAS